MYLLFDIMMYILYFLKYKILNDIIYIYYYLNKK